MSYNKYGLEKDVFRLVTSMGRRKKILSPHWESPQTFGDSTVSDFYYEVHMTRVLHTAGISNVDSVMFVDRIIEMVNFELGREIEKDAWD